MNDKAPSYYRKQCRIMFAWYPVSITVYDAISGVSHHIEWRWLRDVIVHRYQGQWEALLEDQDNIARRRMRYLIKRKFW